MTARVELIAQLTQRRDTLRKVLAEARKLSDSDPMRQRSMRSTIESMEAELRKIELDLSTT
ncbi:hypothetical protein ARHIZOSPH14_33820 [Agromyces rhizosphaerae]|uniref:Uncharacterized protein n=1 Tax=Agromyces rhizosphaerae TaxID=88374 RepID=A0A9W6CZJ5_9MICO|nr:hypothetical protein [Agromyces rhizosphaerae]GLI29140.1 hypothetical protein ARHIZOSPH14_33820 [Agromyces rhizosphaerae]